MQDLLTDQFYKFIQAMTNGDTDLIKQMAEKTFAEKIIANNQHAKALTF